MSPEMWQAVAVIVGPAGAAWIGVKVAVNGMREDVREIKGDVKDLRVTVNQHGERLAVLDSREAT
jgi:hypothetical protein